MRRSILLSLLPAFAAAQHGSYTLSKLFDSQNFFDEFDFQTFADPNGGSVNFVDKETAVSQSLATTDNGMINLRVDSVGQAVDGKRNSVMVQSKETFGAGTLLVVSFAHIPSAMCGLWPSFFTINPNVDDPRGQIDIFEDMNRMQDDRYMTVWLDESKQCLGTLLTKTPELQKVKRNYRRAHWNRQATRAVTGASAVFAMEVQMNSLRIWQFKTNEVPADASSEHPNPSSWAEPLVELNSTQARCTVGNILKHQLIAIKLNLCGNAGGSEEWKSSGCRAETNMTCQDLVQRNPETFENAFFGINHIKLFKDASVENAQGSIAPEVPSSSTAHRTFSITVTSLVAEVTSMVVANSSTASVTMEVSIAPGSSVSSMIQVSSTPTSSPPATMLSTTAAVSSEVAVSSSTAGVSSTNTVSSVAAISSTTAKISLVTTVMSTETVSRSTYSSTEADSLRVFTTMQTVSVSSSTPTSPPAAVTIIASSTTAIHATLSASSVSDLQPTSSLEPTMNATSLPAPDATSSSTAMLPTLSPAKTTTTTDTPPLSSISIIAGPSGQPAITLSASASSPPIAPPVNYPKTSTPVILAHSTSPTSVLEDSTPSFSFGPIESSASPPGSASSSSLQRNTSPTSVFQTTIATQTPSSFSTVITAAMPSGFSTTSQAPSEPPLPPPSDASNQVPLSGRPTVFASEQSKISLTTSNILIQSTHTVFITNVVTTGTVIVPGTVIVTEIAGAGTSAAPLSVAAPSIRLLVEASTRIADPSVSTDSGTTTTTITNSGTVFVKSFVVTHTPPATPEQKQSSQEPNTTLAASSTGSAGSTTTPQQGEAELPPTGTPIASIPSASSTTAPVTPPTVPQTSTGIHPPPASSQQAAPATPPTSTGVNTMDWNTVSYAVNWNTIHYTLPPDTPTGEPTATISAAVAKATRSWCNLGHDEHPHTRHFDGRPGKRDEPWYAGTEHGGHGHGHGPPC